MRYRPAAFKIHKLQLVINALMAKVGDYAAKEKEGILIYLSEEWRNKCVLALLQWWIVDVRKAQSSGPLPLIPVKMCISCKSTYEFIAEPAEFLLFLTSCICLLRQWYWGGVTLGASRGR